MRLIKTDFRVGDEFVYVDLSDLSKQYKKKSMLIWNKRKTFKIYKYTGDYIRLHGSDTVPERSMKEYLAKKHKKPSILSSLKFW